MLCKSFTPPRGALCLPAVANNVDDRCVVSNGKAVARAAVVGCNVAVVLATAFKRNGTRSGDF